MLCFCCTCTGECCSTSLFAIVWWWWYKWGLKWCISLYFLSVYTEETPEKLCLCHLWLEIDALLFFLFSKTNATNLAQHISTSHHVIKFMLSLEDYQKLVTMYRRFWVSISHIMFGHQGENGDTWEDSERIFLLQLGLPMPPPTHLIDLTLKIRWIIIVVIWNGSGSVALVAASGWVAVLFFCYPVFYLSRLIGKKMKLLNQSIHAHTHLF